MVPSICPRQREQCKRWYLSRRRRFFSAGGGLVAVLFSNLLIPIPLIIISFFCSIFIMFSIPFDKDIVRLPLNLSDMIWVLFISLENYVGGIKLSKYIALFIHIYILWFHGVEEVPYLSIHVFPWITTIFHSRPSLFIVVFSCLLYFSWVVYIAKRNIWVPHCLLCDALHEPIYLKIISNVIIVVEMILFVHAIKHPDYPSRFHAWILTNVNLVW